MKTGCRIVLFLTILGFGTVLKAQNGTALTQYFNFREFYNGAAVGNDGRLNISASGRWEHVGTPAYPTIYAVQAGMPLFFPDKYRFGAGVKAFYNHYGSTSLLSASALISYKFNLGNGLLSIGLQPGFARMRAVADFLNSESPELQRNPSPKVSKNGFLLGASIYYSSTDWWLGLSADNLVAPRLMYYDEHTGENSDSQPSPEGHEIMRIHPVVYLMGGGNISISDTFIKIKPSLFFSHCNGYTIAQATALVDWKDTLYGGVGYRLNDAISFIAGASVKGFRIAYSYDYGAGRRSRGSKGSHELTLGYAMKIETDKTKRYRYHSIRYM